MTTATGAPRHTPLSRLVARAASRLRDGGVVAFPTETVYGLGADASNPEAVRRIFEIKGRPADHPLIVHLADGDQAAAWAAEVPEVARRLMARFWPGPLTLVLPARDEVPREVTGGQDSVALRAPSHPLAQALLRAFAGAKTGARAVGLAAPSANHFGRLSPTEAWHVSVSLGGRIDQVLDGGRCRYGLESTIVSLLGDRARLLRPGALPVSALREVLGEDGLEFAAATAPAPRAPGMLAAHYAPATPLEVLAAADLGRRAETLLARGMRVAVLRRNTGLRGKPALPPLPEFLLPGTPIAYARGLYARLRELDRFAFDRLLVEAPPDAEGWLAVNDRLARAAASTERVRGRIMPHLDHAP